MCFMAALDNGRLSIHHKYPLQIIKSAIAVLFLDPRFVFPLLLRGKSYFSISVISMAMGRPMSFLLREPNGVFPLGGLGPGDF